MRSDVNHCHCALLISVTCMLIPIPSWPVLVVFGIRKNCIVEVLRIGSHVMLTKDEKFLMQFTKDEKVISIVSSWRG